MASSRFAAGIGLLAVLVLISGCAVLDSPATADGNDDVETEPDPESLFKSTFVYGDDLEDVSGELTSEATDGNVTVTEVERVDERPYVERRTEVLEASDPDQVGSVYVSNATTSWWYYPDSAWATYYESDEPYDSEETRSDRAEMAEDRLELYDLEYAGTDSVADREAHVLEIEAKEEAVEKGLSILVGDTEYVYALETVDPSAELDVVEQTVWIDTEYDYPLKERLVIEGADDDQYVMTEQFETIEFNTGLGDDHFSFEPPANTTVVES